jgi:hypothetical protein
MWIYGEFFGKEYYRITPALASAAKASISSSFFITSKCLSWLSESCLSYNSLSSFNNASLTVSVYNTASITVVSLPIT